MAYGHRHLSGEHLVRSKVGWNHGREVMRIMACKGKYGNASSNYFYYYFKDNVTFKIIIIKAPSHTINKN
jgi:hypothetical protein